MREISGRYTRSARRRAVSGLGQARIFAALGDRDRTLEALGRGAVEGPFRVGRALAFPEFGFLRGDPRLKAVRKRVGLPE
jgi:hypothetical protein